jgi:hypothetical protein
LEALIESEQRNRLSPQRINFGLTSRPDFVELVIFENALNVDFHINGELTPIM